MLRKTAAGTYVGPWIQAPGDVFADLAAAVAEGADCVDRAAQLWTDREQFGRLRKAGEAAAVGSIASSPPDAIVLSTDDATDLSDRVFALPLLAVTCA